MAGWIAGNTAEKDFSRSAARRKKGEKGSKILLCERSKTTCSIQNL